MEWLGCEGRINRVCDGMAGECKENRQTQDMSKLGEHGVCHGGAGECEVQQHLPVGPTNQFRRTLRQNWAGRDGARIVGVPAARGFQDGENPTKLDMYEFTEIKECVTEWVWGARRSAGKSDNTRHV